MARVWCWDEVAALLRAAGHEVHVPTLRGLGERAHPALARWLDERLTPQPLRTFLEPARLSDAASTAVLTRGYVHCAVGATVPSFAPFAARARADERWRYDELATGHDAMVTIPRELAAVLIDQAAAG